MYMLGPCYVKCEPQMNKISLAWESVKNAESQAPTLAYRIRIRFICTLKFEKHEGYMAARIYI